MQNLKILLKGFGKVAESLKGDDEIVVLSLVNRS